MSILVASFVYNVHTSLTAGYFFRASFESMFRSPRSVCTSCLSLAASSSLSLVCRTPEPLPLAILDPAIEGWSELEPSQVENQQCGEFQMMRTKSPDRGNVTPHSSCSIPFHSARLHSNSVCSGYRNETHRQPSDSELTETETDGVQLSSIWEAISWQLRQSK